MNTSIKIFQSPYELAEKFAEELIGMINESAKKRKPFIVALSGGSTPRLLFSILGDHYSDSASWKYVHLFWSDERCVPPDNLESNYGMSKRVFLDKIKIPKSNIHRIIGENDPFQEADRYADEILKYTRKRADLPVFDIIMLGLGEDGHIASIFSEKTELLTSEKICDIALHPVSSQKRVTITGRVINNADNIVFLVTGANKAKVVSEIIENPGIVDYPAASIEPLHGALVWYLDLEAAGMLNQWA